MGLATTKEGAKAGAEDGRHVERLGPKNLRLDVHAKYPAVVAGGRITGGHTDGRVGLWAMFGDGPRTLAVPHTACECQY